MNGIGKPISGQLRKSYPLTSQLEAEYKTNKSKVHKNFILYERLKCQSTGLYLEYFGSHDKYAIPIDRTKAESHTIFKFEIKGSQPNENIHHFSKFFCF